MLIVLIIMQQQKGKKNLTQFLISIPVYWSVSCTSEAKSPFPTFLYNYDSGHLRLGWQKQLDSVLLTSVLLKMTVKMFGCPTAIWSWVPGDWGARSLASICRWIILEGAGVVMYFHSESFLILKELAAVLVAWECCGLGSLLSKVQVSWSFY